MLVQAVAQTQSQQNRRIVSWSKRKNVMVAAIINVKIFRKITKLCSRTKNKF